MEDAVNGGRLSAAVQKLKQKKGKANGVSGVFTVIGCNVGLAALSLFRGVSAFFTPLFRGDWFTKLSYLFMGTGHFARGQKLKGTLYLAVQIAFIVFIAAFGAKNLYLFFRGMASGGTIGRIPTTESDVYDEELGEYGKVVGDNSFTIIIYAILTLAVCGVFLALYLSCVRGAARAEQLARLGQTAPTLRQELHSLLGKNFHKTLLALPLLGLAIFTVIPLITMIFIAFTNYSTLTGFSGEVPEHLVSWVGLKNFVGIFGGSRALSSTFLRVLGWTLLWAVAATFSNYFIGMIFAILIQKKGIRGKKFFRTVFVSTIAVPQFISLLLLSKMMDAESGIITEWLSKIGIPFRFGFSIPDTRIAILLVNTWVGVPYSMLICSGILMNVPSSMYEAAQIDGAGPVTVFFKITLPYMLHVTAPYLITQFVSNVNNFNVIYLLSGGGPADNLLYSDNAKGTDLLVTWLYSLSIGETKDYRLASVIGIIVFLVSGILSLIVYNRTGAVKKEEEFS